VTGAIVLGATKFLDTAEVVRASDESDADRATCIDIFSDLSLQLQDRFCQATASLSVGDGCLEGSGVASGSNAIGEISVESEGSACTPSTDLLPVGPGEPGASETEKVVSWSQIPKDIRNELEKKIWEAFEQDLKEWFRTWPTPPEDSDQERLLNGLEERIYEGQGEVWTR
jgi:hypothetical protein